VERDSIVAEARLGPGRGAGFVELDAPRPRRWRKRFWRSAL